MEVDIPADDNGGHDPACQHAHHATRRPSDALRPRPLHRAAGRGVPGRCLGPGGQAAARGRAGHPDYRRRHPAVPVRGQRLLRSGLALLGRASAASGPLGTLAPSRRPDRAATDGALERGRSMADSPDRPVATPPPAGDGASSTDEVPRLHVVEPPAPADVAASPVAGARDAAGDVRRLRGELQVVLERVETAERRAREADEARARLRAKAEEKLRAAAEQLKRQAEARAEESVHEAETEKRIEAERRLEATERRLQGLVDRVAREAEQQARRHAEESVQGEIDRLEREAEAAADRARDDVDRRNRTQIELRLREEEARLRQEAEERAEAEAEQRLKSLQARLEREVQQEARDAAEAARCETEERQAELAKRLRQKADAQA